MAGPAKSNSAIPHPGIKARCKAIYGQTRRIPSAPRDIQAIATDLEDFNSKLETLKLHLENKALAAGKTSLEDAFENPLLKCGRVNEFIWSFKARGGVGDIPLTWRKIKYSFGGAGAKTLQNEIATHRLSLNVAIYLVNFLNTNIEGAATRNSDAKISIYLTGLIKNLPSILSQVQEMKSATLCHSSASRLLLVETQSAEIRSYLDRETATLRRIYHSTAVFMPTSTQNIPKDATQVFVKGPGSQTNVVHVKSGQTMYDLKQMIEARTGVPRHLLYFMFAGKVLPSDGTTRSLNIGPDSTLICNARAKGSGNQDPMLFLSASVAGITPPHKEQSLNSRNRC